VQCRLWAESRTCWRLALELFLYLPKAGIMIPVEFGFPWMLPQYCCTSRVKTPRYKIRWQTWTAPRSFISFIGLDGPNYSKDGCSRSRNGTRDQSKNLIFIFEESSPTAIVQEDLSATFVLFPAGRWYISCLRERLNDRDTAIVVHAAACYRCRELLGFHYKGLLGRKIEHFEAGTPITQ
jgi:hypothetical protein